MKPQPKIMTSFMTAVALLALVTALPATTLHAETITISLTAQITYIEDNDDLLEGRVTFGDKITGSYTYDSATPDSQSSPSVGDYHHYTSPYGINLCAGSLVFQTDPNNVDFLIQICNNDPWFEPNVNRDNYLLRSYNNLPLYEGVYVDHISWQLDNNSGQALSSDALPTTPPVLQDWPDTFYGLSIVGGDCLDGCCIKRFRIRARVTSVKLVPQFPTTYYVNAVDGSDDNDGLSPETAFATIQTAIDAAYDGDTVVLADGTYTGEGNRDIDFLGKAITVKSENGPENCIIDCNGTQDDPHRGFYFHSGEDANSVVEGFTIKNGYLTVVDVGGAIYCLRSSPTIANCILKNNSAIAGGAVYCSRSNAAISNSVITSNQANGIGGGIALFRGRNPKVVNCIISYNSGGSGGGIHCSDCNSVISNCIIQANSGTEGGGVNAYAWPPRNITISNCLVSGNSGSQNGGGLKVVTSAPITNCTIVGNSAPRGGGLYKCHAILNNCIIWDNFPQQVVDIYDTTSIIYSNVAGGWAGPGNIDADPRFVDPGYWVDANDPNIIVGPNDPNAIWIDGDYHLLEDSPCIDTGDPNYIPEPNETDLDGNPRIINERIDMGTYEFSPAIEAQMKLTPQTLNCSSKGKYINAHITLPEDIFPEDIDVNTPAVADPPDVDSEYIKILSGDSGPVKLEIAFDRAAFCAELTEPGQIEITVVGYLTTGQEFYGTDTIRIKKTPTRRKSINRAQPARGLRRNNISIINSERAGK